VEGLGPGSVLGGRYTVSRRVLAGHGAERWEARDDHLHRDVTVLAFPSSHQQRDAVFDAARRAAGVRDARLAAVLDVGVDGPVSYVIEEGLPSSRNYATLSVTGGLPAEEVRRIVGETAVGLDAASRRGLHHGALSPEAVLVTEDGDVKLLGLATSAALADHDDEDSVVARRIDAIGLVGLVYAGLSGRWPLGGDNGGLPPAPRIVGGIAPPSEIAVGVPADLDAICRLTLNDDAGPESPGDLAGQIAPWSPTPVQLDAGRWTKDYAPRDAPAEAANAGAQADGTATTDESAAAEGTGSRAAVAGAAAAGAGPAGDAGTAGVDAPPSEGGAGALAPGAVATGAAWAAGLRSAWASRERAAAGGTQEATSPGSASGRPSSAPEPGIDQTRPLPAVGAGDLERPGGAAAAAAAAPRTPAGGRPPGTSGPDDGEDEDGERPSAVASAGTAISAALAKGASSTGLAVSAISDRLGGLVRSSADRAADLTAERRAVRDAKDQWARQHRVALGSTLEQAEVDVEPPAPLLHPDTAEPLSRQESRAALLIVVAFLVIALAIGIWGVSRIGNGSDLGLGAQPRQTTITTPPSTKTATATATGSGGLDPLAIASASAYDPQGDNSENNNQVPRVYDGNPDTYWQSEGYQSANFGGLKNGLGVILDIGANATAKQVIVTVPTTASFQVWINSDKSLDKATLVGESSGQSGQLKLDVPPTAKGQYIVIWFTKAAQLGGRYRAALSEVQVLG
jgi:hypothetical protein